VSALRLSYALLAGALLALPLAHAQTADPTVNQTEMDTSTPPADESYLDDTNGTDANASAAPADPSLNDSDLDTSVPADDSASWLTDSESATPTPTGPAADEGAHATPGFEAVALVGAVAAAIVLARRR
jgi:hypothetical protein